MNISNSQDSMRNVIEYLITKLESRAKYMQKVKQATLAVKGYEDFLENKAHMTKTFCEIEDDLNQGANALKVLNIQNKDLTEQLQQMNRKLAYKESKESMEVKLVKELNDRNGNLLQEIDELRHILDEKDSIISELSDSINRLEEQIDSHKYYNKGSNEIKDKFSKVVEENALMKLQLDATRKKGKLDTKVQNNLKNLVEEKQNSKRKINEKIKDHLSSHHSRGDSIGSQKSPRFSSKTKLQENILQKISESDNLLLFITKTYGNDFMNKLINGQCDENFLSLVQDSIVEFERIEIRSLDNATKPKKGRRLTSNDLISEENEDAEQSETERRRNKKSVRSSSSKNKIQRSNSTSVLQVKPHGKPFENTLRSYNSNTGVAKKFNNFTNPASGYFDKGIATGGVSKLDFNDKVRKKNSRLNKSCDK